MKTFAFALLGLISAVPSAADTAERLIPAGSLIQCTVSEPHLSSKSVPIGDPVLCQTSYGSRYGMAMLPQNSYLIGRFEDYKDPGHFVGKGWMELTFDRMLIQPDTIIPVHARVVDVPGYAVDRQGRILGKGHAVRDSVEWTLPILWPIDLLNLPRRGPRPTLKAETRLTLKVLDDLGVPGSQPLTQDPYGLYRRQPSAYTPPPSAPPEPSVQMEPVNTAPYSAQEIAPAPPILRTASAAARPGRMPYLGPGADRQENQQQPVTLVFNNGQPPALVYNYVVTPTTLYVLDGYRYAVPLNVVDVVATDRVNRMAGVDFHLPVRSQ